MAKRSTHSLYGSTSKSSCVPDTSCAAGGNAPDTSCAADSNTPCANPQGNCLADALIVWECFSNKPLEGAPLVLRFENGDLAASAQNGALSLNWEPVNTAAAEAATAAAATADTTSAASTAPREDKGACTAWVPSESLASALGQQATSMQRLSNGAYQITLETCRIYLEAEGNSVASALVPNEG